MQLMEKCELCPRKCHANRNITTGFCGAGDKIKIARAELHFWEEPCISGKNGSGAVFFSGCPLKCCFCQNYKISSECYGMEISESRLSDIFLELQDKGAHNINLVSAVPYVPLVINALDNVKGKLHLPVIYNSSGFENVETLKMLDGYIDIYLPDFKYADSSLSLKYSSAEDYCKNILPVLTEMYSQVKSPVLDENGIIQKGMIIRHLALPSHRKDSERVLETIAQMFQNSQVLVSIMSQYTPFYNAKKFKEINRQISTYEYRLILEKAEKLSVNGYCQERTAAGEEYIPSFNLEGVNSD